MKGDKKGKVKVNSDFLNCFVSPGEEQVWLEKSPSVDLENNELLEIKQTSI